MPVGSRHPLPPVIGAEARCAQSENGTLATSAEATSPSLTVHKHTHVWSAHTGACKLHRRPAARPPGTAADRKKHADAVAGGMASAAIWGGSIHAWGPTAGRHGKCTALSSYRARGLNARRPAYQVANALPPRCLGQRIPPRKLRIQPRASGREGALVLTRVASIRCRRDFQSHYSALVHTGTNTVASAPQRWNAQGEWARGPTHFFSEHVFTRRCTAAQPGPPRSSPATPTRRRRPHRRRRRRRWGAGAASEQGC